LGCPHPSRLGEEPWGLTAEEFHDWAELYAAEPFGDVRSDLRMGILAATLSNRWRGRSEEAQKPADFMPFLDPDDPLEQTPMDEAAIDAALMRAFG